VSLIFNLLESSQCEHQLDDPMPRADDRSSLTGSASCSTARSPIAATSGLPCTQR
jgi:hypothetical protein